MTTLEDLPIFELQGECEVIGEGSINRVISVAEGLVGKMPNGYPYNGIWSEWRIENLEYEEEMLKRLSEAGVNVPRPEGVYRIGIPIYTGEVKEAPILIMERIPGQSIINIKDAVLRAHAVNLMKQQEELARSASIRLPDAKIRNAIYNPDEDKVYLIDFESLSFLFREENER